MTRDEWREYRKRPEVRESMSIARKKWRTANPETYRAGQKRWASANRDRVQAIDKRHRANRKAGLSSSRVSVCVEYRMFSGVSE